MLATPREVLGDPAVQSRLKRFVGAPRYRSSEPTRADFLAAITPSASTRHEQRGRHNQLGNRTEWSR